MNIWIKLLIGLCLVAAVITVGVMLAPYVLGGLVIWLAWRWMVGSTADLPENHTAPIIEVRPTTPAQRTGWKDPR
jgi:hypothetical protein